MRTDEAIRSEAETVKKRDDEYNQHIFDYIVDRCELLKARGIVILKDAPYEFRVALKRGPFKHRVEALAYAEKLIEVLKEAGL